MSDHPGLYKLCPRCKAPAPVTHAFCESCGRQYRSTAPVNHYPQVGPSPPPVQQQPIAKTDICAILSFAFALAGLWLFPVIFGPAAFVLGIVSRHRIADSSGLLKGTAYQIAGGLGGFAEILMVLWRWKEAGVF